MRDFNIKKLYYSISEVSKITELEQYVLRYWETEFEQLKPQKNRAGNRAYTNKDIQVILLIKKLLKEKKYTIEGAKNILVDSIQNNSYAETNVNGAKADSEAEPPIKINLDNNSIKSDLLEIKKILELLLEKL